MTHSGTSNSPCRHKPHNFLEHTWLKAPGCPCARCGALWPGYELAEPAGSNPGYGELAELPSWRSRVDAMITGLQEVA